MVKKVDKDLVVPILVSGGARSGKSEFAEKMALALAEKRPQAPIAYVATAQATDSEFEARIAHHQARRSARFTTIEEPLALEVTIANALANHSVVLVECMATWLGNLQYHLSDDKMSERLRQAQTYFEDIAVANRSRPEITTLLCGHAAPLTDLSDLLGTSNPVIIFVTNEIGLGIVPATPEARFYRDQLGRFNQHLAAVSHAFFWCISGQPVRIK